MAFSAALCRGLIEAAKQPESRVTPDRFSAALCRGLIEARLRARRQGRPRPRFPRLYAAASLKLQGVALLESVPVGFPRLYAAASLKRVQDRDVGERLADVFRGFMPRPH